MNTKQTVSLCMIVKDEENCLLAAIQSVRNLTDELIVIDTGSTDSTPQLALASGAKLFHFAWTKDFSEARNFALRQVSSDWILVLDADEVLESVSLETFYELLNNVQVEGYFLHIKNVLGPNLGESRDQVVRLFRNKPVYQFEGAIHEQVASCILRANNGNGLSLAPLTLNHYGYLKDRLHSKDKFSRNSGIIHKELVRNPNNPFLLYCLGIEYYQQNSIAEGLKHLTKALVHMSGNEGYFKDVLLNISLGYLRLEETTKLIDFISKALSMYPDQTDFLFLRGTVYLSQTNYREAAVDFNHLLEISEGSTSESNSDNTKNVVHNFLTLALKEIHLCCLVIEQQDMETVHFNAKNKLSIALKEALLILCNALISNSRENGLLLKGVANYETSCSPCQPS
ncbi:glycosyltransferase family 2 protein [Desulfosporosinus metallidurans]|uniref:Glycosyl transferase, group 2 family protein n=1 Tax=Desulfosporosinus metallidurans TaxID=1888891 RepID=A0A1Q8QYD0_9FIRM|nr:glycosyltransferase family 2 protein [Desulfosporosinus metallidurans]OLN32334.1 Glycosyl transferase, group 2 family protein [Desulfosporosinus metallidurans]